MIFFLIWALTMDSTLTPPGTPTRAHPRSPNKKKLMCPHAPKRIGKASPTKKSHGKNLMVLYCKNHLLDARIKFGYDSIDERFSFCVKRGNKEYKDCSVEEFCTYPLVLQQAVLKDSRERIERLEARLKNA